MTTRVIEDESLNAMSLPGGYFFVNTGLILAADTEAELAGGMAHEIAHIAARHATRQATRSQIAQLATIPLIFMGGLPGYGAQQGARVLLPLAILKFDREFENEADMLGLEYLYKSGYDPNGVDILEYHAQRKSPGLWLLRRIRRPATASPRCRKDIQTLLKDQPQYVVSTSEFARREGAPSGTRKTWPGRYPGPEPADAAASTDPHLADSLKLNRSGKHPMV